MCACKEVPSPCYNLCKLSQFATTRGPGAKESIPLPSIFNPRIPLPLKERSLFIESFGFSQWSWTVSDHSTPGEGRLAAIPRAVTARTARIKGRSTGDSGHMKTLFTVHAGEFLVGSEIEK